MIRTTLITLTVLGAAGGCAADDAGATPSKAEAAVSGGKSDTGRDLCAVYSWYGDGECDSFCVNPDPDCGPAVDALARWSASCQLGSRSWLDLTDDLALLSSATLGLDSTLSGIQQQQLLIGLDVGSMMDAFEATDEGEIELHAFGPPRGAATVWLYRYYAGDTEVGFFVAPNAVEILARIEDGGIDVDCAASLTSDDKPVAPPAGWRLVCDLNGDGVDLLRVAIGPERKLAAGAPISADEKKHLIAGMADADAKTVAQAFDATDDNAFFVRTMNDAESKDAFVLYRYWAGDTQVGFVVPATGKAEVKARIEDGELYGCSLAFRP